MSLNKEFRDLADELITEFDERKAIKLITVTSSYNAATYETETTETTETVSAVVTGVDFNVFDRDSVVASDFMLVIQGKENPANFSDVEVDGERYKIVSHKPVKPISGTVIIHKVLCRGMG